MNEEGVLWGGRLCTACQGNQACGKGAHVPLWLYKWREGWKVVLQSNVLWYRSLIQIICLKWFKPHFYTRENDWPQLIWEMEVCSGKVNNSWSEGHVLADSVAADVFSISVSKRETSSSCANGRDICYQCQYFVNYFTIFLVPCLFSLPRSLCFNKYFRWRDILWET